MGTLLRWRTLSTVGVGLVALTANGWGKPQPALPPTPPSPTSPLPTLPSPSQPPIHSPLEDLKKFPPLSPLPPAQQPAGLAPPAIIPTVEPPPALRIPEPMFPGVSPTPPSPLPSLPGIMAPKLPPTQIQESGILEPVTTVHRFKGKYLSNDKHRVLVYVETGNGKAEIQSRPLASAIPDADAKSKDNVKRIEVPSGKVSPYGSHAFLTTPRELLVINIHCEIDWKFTLPGRIDNGEKLLDVAGILGGRVYVVSQQEAKAGTKEEPIGRVYAFEVETGREVAFTTIENGFEANTQFSVNPNGTIASLGPIQLQAHDIATGRMVWAFRQQPHTFSNPSTDGQIAIVTIPPEIVSFRLGQRLERIVSVRGTAPATLRNNGRETEWVYAPSKTDEGTALLCGCNLRNISSSWSIRTSHDITISPVINGSSVYFVAGKTLYRVNAVTGAICWKNTLPLNPGETLNELAFVGDEIRASGPGVLIRVAKSNGTIETQSIHSE